MGRLGSCVSGIIVFSGVSGTLVTTFTGVSGTKTGDFVFGVDVNGLLLCQNSSGSSSEELKEIFVVLLVVELEEIEGLWRGGVPNWNL